MVERYLSLWRDLGSPSESRWNRWSFRPQHQGRTLSLARRRTWRESPDRMMPGLSRQHGGSSGTAFLVSHRFTSEWLTLARTSPWAGLASGISRRPAAVCRRLDAHTRPRSSVSPCPRLPKCHDPGTWHRKPKTSLYQRQCHVGFMSRTAGEQTRARRSSRGCCCSGTRNARPERRSRRKRALVFSVSRNAGAAAHP